MDTKQRPYTHIERRKYYYRGTMLAMVLKLHHGVCIILAIVYSGLSELCRDIIGFVRT